MSKKELLTLDRFNYAIESIKKVNYKLQIKDNTISVYHSEYSRDKKLNRKTVVENQVEEIKGA